MLRIRTINELNKYGFPDHINEQIRRAFRKKTDDYRVADSAPDAEHPFRCQPLGTKENPRFDSPVRIVVRSTRKHETDFRAISEKAVVDGLVKAGILKDDRKKYIADLIVEEPEISTEEKTIIEITEV